MTEDWKKERLDKIKEEMKAEPSDNIVRESWGGDRESASVTKPKVAAPQAAQPETTADQE